MFAYVGVRFRKITIFAVYHPKFAFESRINPADKILIFHPNEKMGSVVDG